MTAERPRFVVACIEGDRIGPPGSTQQKADLRRIVPVSCSILDRLISYREVARYDSSAGRSPALARLIAAYDCHLLNEWAERDDGSRQPRLLRDYVSDKSRHRHRMRARAWAAAQESGIAA